MEGAGWSVLSRPNEGVAETFSTQPEEDPDEDEVPQCLEESLDFSPSSPLSPYLPGGLDWEDSFSQGGPVGREMEAAVSAALSSRSLTPLLKEELRCKIQLRRLQHGEEEITADFSTKTSAMSLEEVAKKNRKMLLNRMSAQRSRQRQKSLEKSIKSRLDMLQNENKMLMGQAQSLRQACRLARDWLQQHSACLQHARNSLGTLTLSPPDVTSNSSLSLSDSASSSSVLPLSDFASTSARPLSSMTSSSTQNLSGKASSSVIWTGLASTSARPLSSTAAASTSAVPLTGLNVSSSAVLVSFSNSVIFNRV